MVSRTNALRGARFLPADHVQPFRALRFAATTLAGFLSITVLFGGPGPARSAFAQSAMVDRLSGFDAARVERAGRWVRQPQDPVALEEAAKLVYQLRRVDSQTLEFASAGTAVEPGDAVRFRGTATEIAALPLPRELAGLLEIPRLFRVTVRVEGRDRYVITGRVPRRWLRSFERPQDAAAKKGSGADAESKESLPAGQPGWSCAIEGVACAVGPDGQPLVAAAAAMQWYPASLERVDAAGIALLARQGFDARLLDEIASLQQQPLRGDEREAFYGMLSAAGTLELGEAPPPEPTGTVELLRRPQELTGHWIRVLLQTVRITRVAVTDPDALERLGQDHYWQIDAMGDLGDLVVRVEIEAGEDAEASGPSAADPSPPVSFANRYPVSVAALHLPDELRDRLDRTSGVGAVVTMLRQPITVDGFYYRLWSYDSEFMQTQAGRRQFGPLLMASRIRVRPVAQGDPLGAAMIGWVAAAVFLVAVVVVIAALWWVGRRDDEVTRRRRAREAEDVRFPST